MAPVKMRLLLLLPASMLAAGLAAAAEAADSPSAERLQPAWRLGVQTRFSEAEQAVPAEAADEEAKFTRAVLLFARQPRTAGRMETAIAELSALAANGSTPSLRARSLYFWARSEELRQLDQASDAAVKLYERLWRDYPQEPFGQRALVHRLLLAFYGDDPRDTVLARCATLEEEAARLTDPAVRSHFYQVAARGYLHLGGAEALALKHLLATEQAGVARREALGDLQVSIGQLGAELGRTALAREHYTAFLREFPHDPRAFMVRAFLAALPAEEGRAP